MIKCELTRDEEKMLSVIEMVMISIDELSVNLLTISLYELIDDEKMPIKCSEWFEIKASWTESWVQKIE